jgi:hypothetical protein
MLKPPLLSVVTAEVSIGVDAPPTVVVFTEYNWMVAPETGCCPPYTLPEVCPVEETVGGPLKLPIVQPVSTAQKQKEPTTADAKRRKDIMAHLRRLISPSSGAQVRNA